MSAPINAGGPAFPLTAQWFEAGMSLRDYFAAKAMAALIGVVPDGTAFGPKNPETNAGLAKCAYTIADAMLAARQE